MKLTSIYYSPSTERFCLIGQEKLLTLDSGVILNTLIYANYELIGYFYDN